MHASCDSRFPALIDQLLYQDISSRKIDQLNTHLKTCASCQRRYNKIVLTSRLLQGGPDALAVPSAGELTRVKRRVFKGLGKPQPRGARWGELPRWVAALASTAAAVALMMPLLTQELSLPGDPVPALPGDPVPALPGDPVPALPGDPVPALPGDPAPGDPYQKRGVSKGQTSDVKIRALCIRGAGEPRILGFSSTDVRAQPNRCGLADVLRFTYTNRTEQGFLFLVGLDEQYRIKWYEPHPPRKTSVPVQTGVVDQPLARSVKLAVNHQEGNLRIFALFSSSPLSSDQISKGVERARAARIHLAKLKTLDLGGVDQQSILLELTP